MQWGTTVIFRPGMNGLFRRFTDNGDGTITDNLTGLMWLKDGGCLKKNLGCCPEYSDGFEQLSGGNTTALGIRQSIPTGVCRTAKELKSLINYGVADSSGWLNSQGFVNTKSSLLLVFDNISGQCKPRHG